MEIILDIYSNRVIVEGTGVIRFQFDYQFIIHVY